MVSDIQQPSQGYDPVSQQQYGYYAEGEKNCKKKMKLGGRYPKPFFHF